ncbi:RHE_PE00001 family protein [Phyllobacterium sp. SB3]|uniref:RHE_PE00001 family protein n=1 Tax=Phyllobacterium sp. SB3 TaxID=3156073 RepID=UPI0032AF32CF
MVYDSSGLSINDLFRPVVAAEDALARLDERISRKSDLNASLRRSGGGLMRENEGWIARSHFMDACNALWLAGELVHVEDLVLHDARMDIRTPTHELTRAHNILRVRRQIAASPPAWALSARGIASLRGRWINETIPQEIVAEPVSASEYENELKTDAENAFEDELARFDALLDRTSQTLLTPSNVSHSRGEGRLETKSVSEDVTSDGDPLVYDPVWNEDERIGRWLVVHDMTRDLPPLLAAALLWDAWEDIEPLQHQHWLGSLLVSAMLRERGKTRSHLAAFNSGLRNIPRDHRRAKDRGTRLTAFLRAVETASIANLKEIERLGLARIQMERKLKDRRSTSSLPGMIDLALSRPMISAGLVARELKVSQRGALNLIGELGLREMTGRGRYRAWGII